MKTITTAISALVASLCVGCGGGDSGPSIPPAPTKTALEGTWISASDGRATGVTCGLTPSGSPGERQTVTFSANTYAYKYEGCVIVTGNTGTYIGTSSDNGTFSIGGVILQSADPSAQMTALDLTSGTTGYTSFNITGNTLHIAGPFQEYTGKTPATRAFQINSYLDPASRKLVINPAYIKQ